MGSTIFHGFGFGMAKPDEFRPVAITTQEDLINAENMCISGGIGTTQVNRTDRMIGKVTSISKALFRFLTDVTSNILTHVWSTK